MEHDRLGVMGHYYSGMLDIYADLTLQSPSLALISKSSKSMSSRRFAGMSSKRRSPTSRADPPGLRCPAGLLSSEIERAARTSIALDRLVEEHKLGSLAYYYKGVGIPENEDTLSSIIVGNSLLTGRGVPVAGELEIKNVQAMKILDCLGAGGSFTEFYANDFVDDVILMGHDGPGHIAIADGKPKLRPLGVYHGKVGSGLSIEMCVKHGPVTLLRCGRRQGLLKFVVAEGESVPGTILEIGNTNSRYRFPIGARGFLQRNGAGPGTPLRDRARASARPVGEDCVSVGIECARVC